MEIAVIGAGIGGLAAAWWLGKTHRVTLLERQARAGFVASSLSVDGPRGAVRVDVPLRVFYPGYYPTLVALYREAGIASEPVSYATTFVDPTGAPYFRWRNARAGGFSLGYVLPRDLRGAAARHIVSGVLRFQRVAPAALGRGDLSGATLGDWLAAQRFDGDFVHRFLLPVLATVGTCTHDAAAGLPAEVAVGYLSAGVMRQSVRRVVQGADQVAQRLAGRAHLVCSADVTAVRRTPHGVEVHRGDAPVQRVDHVVLATQAPQALALLADADAAERAALGAFRTQPVTVVMHTDPALMPAQRRDWSPVNACVDPAEARPMSTIWLNAVQPALRDAADVFQTVHPHRAPAAGRQLGEARFDRPVPDADSAAALAALAALQAQPGRRVWFCGSYAEAGVPLLESAARSARAVAQRLAAAG